MLGNHTENTGNSDSKSTKKQVGIQSIEIGMQVLEALANKAGPMSLTDICTASGMLPSKVHRYLVSYLRCGMLCQSSATGLYDFGPAARRLGAIAMARLDEVGRASDYVMKLREKTGHTVALCVWGDSGPLLVRWEIGMYPMLANIRVGSSLPVVGSTVGKVFLAYLPKAITKIMVKKERQATETDQTDEQLSLLLDEIRETKWCGSASALIPGIDIIAAPIFDLQGSITSVVSLIGPHQYFKGAQLKKLTDELLFAANAISMDIGYRPE